MILCGQGPVARTELKSPSLLEMVIPPLGEVGTSLPSGSTTVQLLVAAFDTYRARSSLLLRVTCCPLVTTSPLVAMLATVMTDPMPQMASPINGPMTNRMIATTSFPTWFWRGRCCP